MSSQLPAYVRALLNPEIYAEKPLKVELIQTQMSFIFLTGQYAYKTKKAVNLGYLDYTTLEKRQYFCGQEVELNRRLCPSAYLGVVPVTQSGPAITIGGKGETIEYAVKMKQLPRDRTMDVLLPQSLVTTEMLQLVAGIVADFHRRAATSATISSFGSPQMIKTNTDENFSQTKKYIGGIIPRRTYDFIMDYTNRFLNEHEGELRSRAAAGRTRDCHGDLHAAHVCFADEIYIFDCIEFNDRFRYCDVASEVAFLAMDLDRYGRADLSNDFIRAYIKESGDGGVAGLLDFYKCYRAYVRGKVACFKYDDPHIEDKKAIAAEAGLYFNLAHKYARTRPVLIIMTGLIGTGKTTVAGLAATGLGFSVLSSDVIRKQLAGVAPTERHHDSFDAGIYAPESTRKTYDELFRRAAGQLKQGHSVILDASFRKKAERLQAQKLAAECGADFLVIECVADEQTIKKWLEIRSKEQSVSDGRWEIFPQIKKDFESVDEIPAQNHLVLDTTYLSGNIIGLILERLAAL